VYHVLGDVRGQRLLDLGCGSGSNTVHLCLRGARVTAVDISEALLRLARQRLTANDISRDAVFAIASAHDLPFASGSIDVVFGIAILHHLDLQRAAAEVHRILKPGGRAIFQEPVRNSRVLRVLRRLIPYHAPDVSPFERPLTDSELQQLASRFSQFRAKAFTLPFVKVALFVPQVRRNPAWLYALDLWLLTHFPRLRSYASIWVVELVK
jgi:ubiquinone/menaquinone biosynthesis C-methylase UbiE